MIDLLTFLLKMLITFSKFEKKLTTPNSYVFKITPF